MKARIEAKNISVDTISEFFPNLTWEKGLRKCNKQWNSGEQKGSWHGIGITQWVVDECDENVLVFDTRMQSNTIHDLLCPIVQSYVDKKQSIKITTYRKSDKKIHETVVTNIKAANIPRITELYEKARNENLQYVSRRFSQRRIAGRSALEWDLDMAIASLKKLMIRHEYDDPILIEALKTLRAHQIATQVSEKQSYQESKVRIVNIEDELQALGAFHSTFIWRVHRSKEERKKQALSQ
jgi:hypothetical protein